jgi:hypothetical protein
VSDEDSDDRGFRFKSTAERLVPLRRSECRNCTRQAVPDGRLCKECLSAYRSDRTVGQYPTSAAVMLLATAAVVVFTAVAIVPGFIGDDAPAEPRPTVAAPAADVTFEEPAPVPVYTPAPTYSASAPTGRSNAQSSSATSEAAFIATLNANDVEYSSKSNAVKVGRGICKVIASSVDSGFTFADGMDAAESILVTEGYAANDAAAYVGAAAGALC